MTDLKSMTLAELESFFLSLGHKKYRAKQAFDWIHAKRVCEFNQMENLPKDLLDTLDQRCILPNITLLEKRVSTLDGSAKYLFALADGEVIETVVMHYERRSSVCISSQVGCKMGCTFCASTKEGYVRNLSCAEMLSQVYFVQADQSAENKIISHVVLMGIGEPLENYHNVVTFLHLINHPHGANISMRHLSISTCGLVDRINELAELKLGLTLSISLHAVENAVRNRIMPINRRYPIATLLEACRHYTKTTGRRISIEYALINQVNDTLDEASKLAHLLGNGLFHINLIPINAIAEGKFKSTARARVLAFQDVLKARGMSVTVRRTVGSDIEAACGQLRRHQLEKYPTEKKIKKEIVSAQP